MAKIPPQSDTWESTPYFELDSYADSDTRVARPVAITTVGVTTPPIVTPAKTPPGYKHSTTPMYRDNSIDVITAVLDAEVHAGYSGVMLRTSGKDIHIMRESLDITNSHDDKSLLPESLGTVRDFLLFLAEKGKTK